MDEIARLNGGSDAIELDFVEREATPTELMEVAIHLHLDGLSLADTVAILYRFGVSRARSTAHNCVRYKKDGNRNAVERVFREIKRQTLCFSNCFSNSEAETVDDWLRSFSFAWNQLI